jgi:predicted glycoside hydrolase/deacetylase ChbG (UPF0249 family)
LIVNADDFGLSDGVNEGIVRAHRDGIVTSTSLMVRQPAAQAAAAAAADFPELSVGLHLDLGEWEQRDGDWHARYVWIDDSNPDEVADELEHQLAAFRALLGRRPTHLDSHQHVHRDEPLRSILSRAAEELGIPLRHHSDAQYYGGFYGQARNGTRLREAIEPAALAALILELPDGTTELCCHPAARTEPGWQYGRERLVELEALCHPSVRAAVTESGVHLQSFARSA